MFTRRSLFVNAVLLFGSWTLANTPLVVYLPGGGRRRDTQSARMVAFLEADAKRNPDMKAINARAIVKLTQSIIDRDT